MIILRQHINISLGFPQVLVGTLVKYDDLGKDSVNTIGSTYDVLVIARHKGGDTDKGK